MKWKKPLYNTSIILLLFTSFLSVAYADWEIDDRWEIDSRWDIEGYPPATPAVSTSYSNHLASADGNCLMYGGIQLKPNTIHTYIPQYNGRIQNLTLYSGTLGLSKGDYAYNIACSTNDNVTIDLNKWFYSDTTQFRPLSEDESSLSFTVNARNRGEPRSVSGASSWSYNEATTTVTLTSGNYSLVTIRWVDMGTKQLEWYLDLIPMWLGIFGLFMVTIGPVMFVYFGKQDEWNSACVWGLMSTVIGMGLVIGWLW